MPDNKWNILVLDDDASVTDSLKLVLESCGHSVTAVLSVEKAQAILGKVKFDLILVDYLMSPITGKEFLISLRKRGIDTPVVMISSYWTTDGWFEMKSLGAFTYLAKSLDFSKMKDVSC